MKSFMLRRIGFLLLTALLYGSASAQSFPISTPEREGVPSEAVLSLLERFENDIDAVHSIMILRHGKRITQAWWAPYDAATPHVLHSLSKSFTSTAIGLAVGDGLLSLDDPLISFFPEDTPKEPSWQLKAMRIRDLLTMNTGHRREPRLRNESKNWVRAFLHSEIEFKPGTHFQYNSAATYMLSAILQKVTGNRLVDYLDKRLFQPLGIQKPKWDLSPDGVNTGGWGLRVTTEDIAKLGQLYLQKGVWQDKRILSEDWVQQATSKQTSNGSNPDSDWDQGYGYQFWRCRHDCYRGDGAFGQYCIVIPQHDVVVAVTSGVSDMGSIMTAIWDTLLPALGPSPLGINRGSSRALGNKLQDLSLPTVRDLSELDQSPALPEETFHLKENEAGVQSITFSQTGTEHHIELETTQGKETLRLGTDAYLRSSMDSPLPYTQNKGTKIGASGAWIEADIYQARIYFCETPASIDYTFRFEDGGLIWESELRHSLFGPRETPAFRSK